MSKKNTNDVFVRGFLQVIMVAICMVAVGFLSYHGVFWYFSHEREKANAEAEKSDSNVVYTAVMFNHSTNDKMEGIMVKVLNKDTNNMDFVIVPTNTEISAGSSIYSTLKQESSLLPEPMTIGEITTVVSDETKSDELVVQALEELLGIENIDSYETYGEEKLVSIVDLLPQQSLEVPITISTKNTNGVELTLEQGTQSLDGEKACALLAFTGYPQGAVDQAKIMAQFFSNYYKTALALEESKKQEFYEQYYSLVTTNSDEESIAQYKENFVNASPNQVQFHLVEGTQNGTVYQIDSEQAKTLISTIVETTTVTTTEQDMTDFYVAPVASSKDLDIKVFNGTTVEGLATEWVHRLSDQGYSIVGAANGESQDEQNATIYVKKEGTGLDLKAYFPDATYITDTSLSGFDIKIVLGMAQAQS